MVIDASALIAILEGEPEEDAFKRAISQAGARLMSPVNLLEAHMIARRRGEVGVQRLDDLVARTPIQIVPIDVAQAAAAREAFDRFGKGRHAAGLNLGDCFAYALAKTRGQPLLFKGQDFAATDVIAAA